MKKLQYILALIISILIISTANAAWDQTKRHTYSARTALGTLTDGDIAVISGESIISVGNLWDNCVVMTGNTYMFYEGYDSGNTALHNPPLIIVPWDMNANGRSSNNGISGTSAWRLMSSSVSNFNVEGWTNITGQLSVEGGVTISGNVDFSGASVSVNTPTDNSHAATMAYVIANAGGGGSGLTPYSINTMGRTGVSTMGFRGVSGVSYSVGGATVYGGFETTGVTIGGVTVTGLANLESGVTVVGGATVDQLHTMTTQDDESGVTVETSSFAGGYAIQTAGNTWRIFADDNDGGDLFFTKNGTEALELTENTAEVPGNFTANGPITSGGSIYAYDILGAGGVTEVSGLYLYTDNYLTGNYTVIKPHGLQSENLEFTLPINSGTSDQTLKTNGSGQLAWSADEDTNATSGTTDSKGMGVVFAGNGTVTSGDSIYIPSPIGGTIEWVEIISDNPTDMTISFDLLRGSTAGTTNVTIADKIINTVTYSSGQSTYVSQGGTTSIAVRQYLALQLTSAGGGVSKVSVMIGIKTQGGGEGVSQATLTSYTNAAAFSGSTGGVSDFVTGSTDWSGVVGASGGGSGLTTVQTDDGSEAEAATLGDAPSGIFIVGASGVSTTATGNTVYVGPDITNLEPLINIENLASGTSKIFDKVTDLIEYISDISSVTSWIGNGVSIFVSGTTDWTGIIHPSGTTDWSGIDYIPGTTDWSGEASLEAVLDIEDLVSGTSLVFDKVTDSIEYITDVSSVTSWLTAGVSKFVSGTTDWTGVKTTEADMVWDSGTTIASAVTKVATFTVINPQDIGGGSANSPFTIFSVPTFIYPNGVYVVGVGIGGQEAGAGFNTAFIWTEWSSGSCVFNIAGYQATTNAGLAEDDIEAGATCLINGGNSIRGQLDNTSGVSEVYGFIAFKPL